VGLTVAKPFRTPNISADDKVTAARRRHTDPPILRGLSADGPRRGRVWLLVCMVTVMNADEALEVLRGLVAGAVRAPEEVAPRGASPAEIDSLQARLGCGIPPALRGWLSVCRGAGIGPGGVFGPRPDRLYLDMAQRRDSFPEWVEQGWLPVAGDGCGTATS
jgi:SMI1 / KNR4 family (SUKH-1)